MKLVNQIGLIMADSLHQFGDYYRVLTIDGGGMKGIIPLAFLSAIEEHLAGNRIGEYFDLISGTSTGGIIAAGLALESSATDLLDIYKKKGPGIFSESSLNREKKKLGRIKKFWMKRLGIDESIIDFIHGPKYNTNKLEETIDDIVKNKLIKDATTRLLIPAWDQINKRVRIYETAHRSQPSLYANRPVKEALMATTAAPLYFPAHVADVELIDGSLWAYNPILLAVVEAISIWGKRNIRVLSLSCSDEVYMPEINAKLVDMVQDGPRLFLDAQSKGAVKLSEILLESNTNSLQPEKIDSLINSGPQLDIDSNLLLELSEKFSTPIKKIFRTQAHVPKDYFQLDDTSKINKLSSIGKSSAENYIKNEIFMKIFFSNTIISYTKLT